MNKYKCKMAFRSTTGEYFGEEVVITALQYSKLKYREQLHFVGVDDTYTPSEKDDSPYVSPFIWLKPEKDAYIWEENNEQNE